MKMLEESHCDGLGVFVTNFERVEDGLGVLRVISQILEMVWVFFWRLRYLC